ncbi:MAG: tail fiber protein [Victivallaceae bacterium]|nr:tail fiber protein [Victivallaceae bacterium]
MDAYTGEIRMIAGCYAPEGWALCDGRLLERYSYPELFSLFGRTYGEDGTSTFRLPDLRGRIPVHCKTGSSSWSLGRKPGTEQETISEAQMAPHNHPMQASRRTPYSKEVANNIICNAGGVKFYRKSASGEAKETSLALQTIDFAGGDSAHKNLMPYLCINFIVCLQGTYPPRPDEITNK